MTEKPKERKVSGRPVFVLFSIFLDKNFKCYTCGQPGLHLKDDKGVMEETDISGSTR